MGATTSTAVPAKPIASTTSVTVDPRVVHRTTQATVDATVRAAKGAAPTGEVTTTVRQFRPHGNGPVVAQVTQTLTPGPQRSSVARLRLPRLPVGLYVVDTPYAGRRRSQPPPTRGRWSSCRDRTQQHRAPQLTAAVPGCALGPAHAAAR